MTTAKNDEEQKGEEHTMIRGMHYAIDVYVTAAGGTYGASHTDQRYTRAGQDGRTVAGQRVGYAGRWYGSQMRYQPYRDAVADAQATASAGALPEPTREAGA